MLWVADITYLRTWEGWVYLAAVQDAYSRRIVGWSIDSHLRAELVVDALDIWAPRGGALDNAVCEAFFATLKKELTRRRAWPTRPELQTAVFAWIEGWYNRRCLHSTLGIDRPPTTRTTLSATAVLASPLRGSHPHQR